MNQICVTQSGGAVIIVLSYHLIIILASRVRGIRGNQGLNLKINFIDGQCLMRGQMDDNAKYQSQSNTVHKYLKIIHGAIQMYFMKIFKGHKARPVMTDIGHSPIGQTVSSVQGSPLIAPYRPGVRSYKLIPNIIIRTPGPELIMARQPPDCWLR